MVNEMKTVILFVYLEFILKYRNYFLIKFLIECCYGHSYFYGAILTYFKYQTSPHVHQNYVFILAIFLYYFFFYCF